MACRVAPFTMTLLLTLCCYVAIFMYLRPFLHVSSFIYRYFVDTCLASCSYIAVCQPLLKSYLIWFDLIWPWMTFKVIRPLQFFSNAVRRTFSCSIWQDVADISPLLAKSGNRLADQCRPSGQHADEKWSVLMRRKHWRQPRRGCRGHIPPNILNSGWRHWP